MSPGVYLCWQEFLPCLVTGVVFPQGCLCGACELHQTHTEVTSPAAHKTLCFISGENMVSLMTALRQVIIPMIVLFHVSASLSSRER